VLAEEPREWPRLLVTVGFKDTAPSEENARGLVGRVRGAEAKLQRQEGRTMEFQSAQIVCPSGDSNSTNKNLYLWMKSFLTRVVLPLHDAHPVAEVHFRRD
jgi:hypothetical protein